MDLITRLNLTSSRDIKKRKLKQISLYESMVFEYAYNPYKVYNLKFASINYDNLGEPNHSMFKLLDGILDGTIARGNLARDKVEDFAEDNGDLIKAIINKDLKCGVTAKTFNSVHPGTIPQFDVQLAKEVPIIDLNYPLLAQLKYDGVRLITINRDGDTTFYTRNGLKVAIPKLKALLDSLPIVNYMLDGEITLLSGKMEDRTKISGMVNSAIHGGVIMMQHIRIHVFDFMRLEEWDAGECLVEYAGRYEMLMTLLSQIKSDHLIPAHTMLLANAEDANDYYQTVIEEGYEGLILKSEKHLYTFKRSKDWVKVKETKTCDLKCVGFVEAKQGKLEGGIGALCCEGIVEGKEVKVDVAGLTMLAAFAPFDTTYNGKTLEVKYNSLIKDKLTGQHSLFLPRYSCVRFDK